MEKRFLETLAEYNKSVTLDEFIIIIKEKTFSTLLVRNISFNQYNLLFTNNEIKQVYSTNYNQYDKEILKQHEKGLTMEYLKL